MSRLFKGVAGRSQRARPSLGKDCCPGYSRESPAFRKVAFGKGVVRLLLEVLVTAPFLGITLVVRLAGRSDCLVVDPGFEPEKIVSTLRRAALTPAAILLTHGHADHIAGNMAMRSEWPDLPIMIGTGDAPMLT